MRLLAAMVVFCWMLQVCPVLGQGSGVVEVCEYFRANWTGSKKPLLQRLTNRVQSIFNKANPSYYIGKNDVNVDDNLYYTNTSGFSYIPICLRDGIRYQIGMYFPIGLVSRKILEVANPQLGPLWLVEAEHGLYMLIKSEDLGRLSREKIYLFANSASGKQYCIKTSGSDCALKDPRRNDHINGSSRYAIVKNIENRSANHGCNLFIVDIYDNINGSKEQKINNNDIIINKCIKVNGVYGEDAELKIVTYGDYNNRFKYGPRGTVLRVDPPFLSEYGGGGQFTKRCGAKITHKIEFDTGYIMEVPFDIYFFKFKANLGLKYNQQTITEYKEDTFRHYSTFFADDRASVDENELVNLKTLAILSIFECDKPNINPDLPRKIEMDTGKIIRASVSINVNMEDFNHWIVKYADITREYRLGHKSMYEVGKMWAIHNERQYFYVRDTLYTIIASQIGQLYTNTDLKRREVMLQREKSIQFFSHIIMEYASDFVLQ